MFKDLVWKYYYKANGYNYSCSKAMIHASNDYFHLDLSEDVFRLVCAYSGGAGHDEMCGALASAIGVLSVLYSVNQRAHDSARMKELRNEFFARFDSRMGPYRCLELKKRYADPVRKCETVVCACADILEEILRENPPEED